MKPYTAIYDFSLYPYALGDTFTWNVRTAMAAHEAGAKSCRVVAFADSAHPHCVFQVHPKSEQYELFQCEIQPAFYTHPCATSFHLFHDRKEFDSYLNFLVAEQELSASELAIYKKISAQRDNHKLVTEHFTATIGSLRPVNEFFKKHGFIPKPKEVIGARYDVEALIAAQERDTQLVCIQFRMRSLDQWHPGGTARDADFDAWHDFIVRCGREMPRVKFFLLGRLQEKHLSVLALPNVIAPRALGLNLAHEISLFLRSDFFLGSSSGFAQLAYFSDVPYRISNVPPATREADFDIPAQATRQIFAQDNQRLLDGAETSDGLFAALAEGLAKCPPRLRTTSLNPTFRKFQTTSRLFLNAAQGQYETASRLLPVAQQAIHFATEGKAAETLGQLIRMNEILLRAHRTSTDRKVTVGRMMPNFNHGGFLEHAFAAIAAQTVPADEVIVIDDGSTDDSVTKIKAWGAQSPTHKILLLPKNSGVNAATDAGLDHVTTDFFSPGSVDDTFFTTHIEKISLLAQSYPRAGLVSFRALRHDVVRHQRYLGPQLCPFSRFVDNQEVETVLRYQYLWDAGIAWNTEAFKAERNFDWRLRWISGLHVADVLAFRHGFSYVAEPLMEYNMRPQSYSSGGSDSLRQGEAFLASARDWCSPAKAGIFNPAVRSGFFGLRENALLPIQAVLNGSWSDHGKPLLLILHGLIDQFDQLYEKAGVPPSAYPRKDLNNLAKSVSDFRMVYDEPHVFKTLIPFFLSIIKNSPLNNSFIGFYAGYLLRLGCIQEAHEILRTRLVPGKRPKSLLRAFAQLVAKTESEAAGDRAWREALAVNPADVWFGMEYVQILHNRGQTNAALELAETLYQRDPKADVLKELREILPEFVPAGQISARPIKGAVPAATVTANTENLIEGIHETAHREVFSQSEVEAIATLLKNWLENPIHNEMATELLTLRGELSAFLLDAEPDGLADLFATNFGQVYRLLLHSSLQHLPLGPEDAATLATIQTLLVPSAGRPPAFRALLAAALFQPAHDSRWPFPHEFVPGWFWDDYLAYNLTPPQGCAAKHETDRHLAHLLAWVKDVAARIKTAPSSELTLKLAHATAQQINLLPADFKSADAHQLKTLRAEIMNFTQPLARVS